MDVALFSLQFSVGRLHNFFIVRSQLPYEGFVATCLYFFSVVISKLGDPCMFRSCFSAI
eukprot:c27918_g1_i1 orf=109-285(+)